VDILSAHSDLKDNLLPGRPPIVSKRNGGIYYDRMGLFSRSVKKFILEDLSIQDLNGQPLHRIILMINGIAACFVSLPTWSFLFKQANKPPNCSKDDDAIA